VAMLGVGAILVQRRSSSANTVKLTTQDMQILLDELVPPPQQAQIASNPEEKQEFLKFLRQMLALGQAAEQENYHTRPDVKPQLDLQTELTLVQFYRKKNPDATVSDEEAIGYFQAHPNEWTDFVEANPQVKEQAARADEIKKQLGQIKVFVERARKEGIDKEQAARLRILIARHQILAEAYRRELQKNSDKQVSDAEVEQYFKDNKGEFEQVHARHILISTNPPEADDGHGHEADKKAGEKKALTRDEARAKAQSILDRVRKGEDFAKLAQENSDDPGSKTKGGDLDFFSRGDMVKPFDDTAFSLAPGQVSDLVETQFGFHIIKVEERRDNPVADEQTKEKIRQKLEQQAFEKKIEDIVSKSKVEVAEDFSINVNPAPATPQNPPAGQEGGAK
jgi:parvulin-like peptidyl-prolyl isomerase